MTAVGLSFVYNRLTVLWPVCSRFADIGGLTMTTVKNADRYLHIVRWLKRRYRRADGLLVLEHGGKPSMYARVEYMAFCRYVA